jgi:restriction endonuclease S subunit
MNNVMSQIKIILPSSIEEQSLISKKLILIEDVLFQHKHQIIKLNNIKKAFLAKMFI